MGFLELMLLAVGLSMDALAVSICKGLAMDRVTLGRMVLVGLWFGGFQGLMPLLGWLLGSRFSLYITAIDHWIAFVLLCFIGGMVGGKIPGVSCKTAGIAGGVVLCGIGIKLLIEGLVG